MRSPLAQAIRDARLTVRLTQDDLGARIGLKGRAVYRWERDESAPRRRHHHALVAAIQMYDADAAKKLKSALDTHGGKSKVVVIAAPAPPPAPAQPTGELALELAIFAMADELDLAPRRVRASLAKLLARLSEAGFSLDAARRQVEARIAAGAEAVG